MHKMYRDMLGKFSLLIMSISLSPAVSFAVDYSFPADFPPQTVPFDLANSDTLTVTSGTMQTASGDSTDNTVDFSAATTGGVTITINSGATLGYNGDNGAAASIFSSRSTASATTNNIVVNGTLESGTGLYGISLVNAIGVTASDNYNININDGATVTGTILTSGVANATINITGTPTINGTIVLATASTGSSLLLVGASGTATFTPSLAISDIANVQISNNSTMTLGVDTSDISAVNIDVGSTLNLNSQLNGLSSGDGNIVNNGTLNIAANIAKTGGFTGTGTNVVTQSTSGLSITTNTYQVANHTAVMQDINNYGNITLSTANFALAAPNVFTVAYGTNDGYSPGYFPGGTYTLVTTTGGTVTAATTTNIPNNTMFLTFNTPVFNTNNIQVTLNRTPYTSYAITNLTKSIAANLEIIGNSSPSDGMLSLLNAVEESTSVNALQTALEQLSPLATPTFYSYQVQNDSMRQAHLRLAELRDHGGSYFAGDIGKDSHLWARPFKIYANQDPKEDSFGYYATTGGAIFGFDRNLGNNYTLGAGFAYGLSTIEDKINWLSRTTLKSYIFLVYGSYDFGDLSFLDWVFSFTSNRYEGNRIVDFNSYNQTAFASYSNQQGSINALYSKNYEAFGFMQLTPEGFIQYTFNKQYPYTETGATGANLEVTRSNANLLTLGLGSKASIPLLVDPSIAIPEIHGMVFYNPLIGNENTVFSFTEGGGLMFSDFSLSRFALRIGAAFTLAVIDKLELKFNLDYDVADRFHGYTAFLNLKYVF